MFRSDPIAPLVPLPLLITGVAGVAGYNALTYFRARYPGQVIGIRQQDNWRLAGPGIVACNAEDQVRLAALFEEYRFASVLDCAGNCACGPASSTRQWPGESTSREFGIWLRWCAAQHSRFVHLSIDLVFSGTGPGSHLEHDPTDPVTVYGKTMVAAESLIQAELPDACILRISLPMGVSFNGHAGAIDWIQSRFEKSRPATLYFDEIRTPTYTDCLNRLCEHVLGRRIARALPRRRPTAAQPL